MGADMASWNGMLNHATSTTVGDIRTTRGAAISESEARDLASTAISTALSMTGGDARLHQPMMRGLTDRWSEVNVGDRRTPAQIASPLVQQVNRLDPRKPADRAKLESIRDNAFQIHGDADRQRQTPDNIGRVAPQMGRIQDFARALYDAASARLRLAGAQ